MSERLLRDSQPTTIITKKNSAQELREISNKMNFPDLASTSAFKKYTAGQEGVIHEEGDHEVEEEDQETSISKNLLFRKEKITSLADRILNVR